MNQIQITLEGKTFKNKKEACRYYNLNYGTVCSRLDRGWSNEEAFGIVFRGNNRPVTLEGVYYKTTREACRYYNLDYSTVCSRLDRGWSNEEAFEIVDIIDRPVTINGIFYKSIKEASEYYNTTSVVPSRLRTNWDIIDAIITPPIFECDGTEITLEGKSFISIAQACRYYKLNYKKVCTRLARKWSLEEAFELVERPKIKNITKNIPVTLENKLFESISQACRYYKLNIRTVNKRLARKWSLEEAFELVERKNKYKQITLEGRTFESIKEACRYYNLNYSTVNTRLSDDWSIEEAFELVPRNNSCKPITVEKKEYNSIIEACEYYNLRYSKVVQRLNNGWTIEEAFELVPRKKEISRA